MSEWPTWERQIPVERSEEFGIWQEVGRTASKGAGLILHIDPHDVGESVIVQLGVAEGGSTGELMEAELEPRRGAHFMVFSEVKAGTGFQVRAKAEHAAGEILVRVCLWSRP